MRPLIVVLGLLALAACHGSGVSEGASEAQQLNEAAASIDINAASATNDGGQAQ